MVAPQSPASGDTEPSTGPDDGSDKALSTLRGAGVDVDVRRVGRVVGAVCLVALAAVAIALFVAGADKNDEITQLRGHGVAVEVTVTTCLGSLGGSGSNAAGYECKGAFALSGHRYSEDIPGNTIRTPGSTIRAVAVPGNPPLLSTARAVATDRPSWHVFVVPTILIVVDALLVGVVVVRRRHTHPRFAARQ
jgi:hypothetical protein